VQSALRKLAERVELINTPEVIGAFSLAPLDLPDTAHAQLWPHRHGTDAMFIQLLRKKP
jgi:16S rRNA (cytosine967-C5)-methyltransferase